MSLPGDRLPNTAPPAPLLSPDSLGRQARIIDYERGGIALNDPSQGLDVQDWQARLVGNEIRVSPAPYTTETVVVTEAGITELSLAFDQNMAPNIAYMALGQAKLYWYDTTLGAQTTTILDADVRSPFLTLDDKRPFATTIGSNDVLLFYIRSNRLCYREQRDRYNNEVTLAWFEGSAVTISKAGMNSANAMQVELVGLQNIEAVGAVLGTWREAAYLASVTSIARAMPDAIETGDLLYAALMHRSAVTPPAGWTLVTSQACTAGIITQTLSIFRKTTVAPADSGVSVTFTQSASDRMGLAYFAVRGTPSTTPAYVAASAVAVNDVATNTVTAPIVTAATPELMVMVAASINATADVTQPSVAAGLSLVSGQASQTRLGVAYQRRKAGQTNAGRFTFDNGTPANNGLAAITLRFNAS